jgi:hypothetical protein
MTVDTGLSDIGRGCLIYRGRLIDRQCLIVCLIDSVFERDFLIYSA